MTQATVEAIAVEAKQISLGSIELEVYRPVQPEGVKEILAFPAGEIYRLSKTQILEAIGASKNWLSRLPEHTPKALISIQERGYTGHGVRASIKLERGATQADTLSVQDAVAVWGWFARKQNIEACDLLEACANEAIERRADLVFGILKTTEQYEEKTTADLSERRALREDLKKGPHKILMSALVEWEKLHDIYGTVQGKEWFRQTLDTINVRVQGIPAHSIRDLKNIKKGVPIRDMFTARSLVHYSAISQITAGLLASDPNNNPVLAVSKACDIYLGKEYKPGTLELEVPV